MKKQQDVSTVLTEVAGERDERAALTTLLVPAISNVY